MILRFFSGQTELGLKTQLADSTNLGCSLCINQSHFCWTNLSLTRINTVV